MSTANFCIDAQVCTVYDVPIEKKPLMQFLSQPQTFEKYMPSVRAVKLIGKSQAGQPLYEWHYDVEMPLAPTLHITIPTEFCKNGEVFTHHTPDDEAHNWMACSLSFESVPQNEGDEPHTLVKMNLHIKLRRHSGSELHPLGALMGQAFMCSQMKNRMQEIANTFVQRSVNALYQELQSSR
ncbi:MAG: hypothetical protein RMI34_00525 [Chloroherpetonaceae bacterium]|nr:hypothetical protein [Chloroherpetonaceae bacterium]MCS7211053.1 hypothetical protein [Chloroherpetonaceae bacterium]MDW8018543.1 hypothetical protein [Chloroherpetonaceae bacterium]MDW8467360.1 hypothetical protein [Chloroherpetonaceae bacterium]